MTSAPQQAFLSSLVFGPLLLDVLIIEYSLRATYHCSFKAARSLVCSISSDQLIPFGVVQQDVSSDLRLRGGLFLLHQRAGQYLGAGAGFLRR